MSPARRVSWSLAIALVVLYLIGVRPPAAAAAYAEGVAGWAAELLNGPLRVPVLFALAFGVLWLGTCYALAAKSGWRALAAAYAAEGRQRGVRTTATSGQFGAVGFSNALRVGGSGEGLVLKVRLPFRFGFRPLLLPWDALTLDVATLPDEARHPTEAVHLSVSTHPEFACSIPLADFRRSVPGAAASAPAAT